jgi:hypothetical protein
MNRPIHIDDTIRKLNILQLKYGKTYIFDIDGKVNSLPDEEFKEFIKYIEKLEKGY